MVQCYHGDGNAVGVGRYAFRKLLKSRAMTLSNKVCMQHDFHHDGIGQKNAELEALNCRRHQKEMTKKAFGMN